MLLNSPASHRTLYLEAAKELQGNEGQWQAYESKGNCIILAGPGSGKTKTLTIKMARILAEDVRFPRGVACITYNSECVRELKRRLDRLGLQEGKNVFVGTVHSFCLKNVILPYGRLASLSLPEPLTVASPSEQENLFEQALFQDMEINGYPSDWRTRMDRYRRTYLDREASEWRTSDGQLANLIEAYERRLRKKGWVDFDDMVLLGLRLIEENLWVRKALRARFPVIIVDEYQDLGIPLHRIVQNLLSYGFRLIAVGDPDQSIYGFTGANPEVLKQLAGMKEVELVRLQYNYRSGKNIIGASEIALGEKRNYTPKGEHPGIIEYYECYKGLQGQADQICRAIIPKVLKRKPSRNLGDIAVLYLNKNDGDIIAGEASKYGMKFIRVDRNAPYRKTPLTQLLEDCAVWCSGGWKQGTPRLSTLLRSWFNFSNFIFSEDESRILRLALIRFLFSHRLPDVLLKDWLTEFDKSFLCQYIAKGSVLRDEEKVFTDLFLACKKGGVMENFTVRAFAGQAGSPDHLNLITLYSAKGLEFDAVIMMGMEQGRIPSYRAKSEQAKKEPRRLFYVGLTRARHEVHMTYSDQSGPSEFLAEIQESLPGDL